MQVLTTMKSQVMGWHRQMLKPAAMLIAPDDGQMGGRNCSQASCVRKA